MGAQFMVPVLPAGKVGQEKGDGTRADFLTPAAPGVGTSPEIFLPTSASAR